MAISKTLASSLLKLTFAGGDIRVAHPGHILYSLRLPCMRGVKGNYGQVFVFYRRERVLIYHESSGVPLFFHGSTDTVMYSADRAYNVKCPDWTLIKDKCPPTYPIKVLADSHIPILAVKQS